MVIETTKMVTRSKRGGGGINTPKNIHQTHDTCASKSNHDKETYKNAVSLLLYS
jgi:hypothetical protein